jgi:hypothetical protein
VKKYRSFLYFSILLLLGGILLGVGAKGNGPLPTDLPISRGLQSVLPYNHTLALFWSGLGKTLQYLPYIAIVIALILRRWDAGILLALAFFPLSLFAEPRLKSFYIRPRPTADLVNIYEPAQRAELSERHRDTGDRRHRALDLFFDTGKKRWEQGSGRIHNNRSGALLIIEQPRADSRGRALDN